MSDPSLGAAPASTQPAGNATVILVLSIIGFLCCPLLSPVAWYMGAQELKRIAAGEVAAASEGTAKAGMIIGIIGTVILGLTLIWFLFFGGLAVIGALSEGF